MDVSIEDWNTLSRLLDEALDLPVEERDPWLDEITESQPELAPALRRLLEAHATDETNDVLARLPQLPEAAEHVEQQANRGIAGLATGATVGPYRLLREVGRGGMADVWLAERADGAFTREVAVKLPLITRLRPDLVARFERERDILARLEHRHIARFYDAGVTDDGLPYLAMEYVAGQPITVWCDARTVGINQRIALFAQVLDAVQYAHANLIVHRDLKPSNILVANDGQVRLLDFGIAKLLGDEDGGTRETALTQMAGRALTPDYASPEQIKGEPLTTASDIYSLGVVLFELLTGARPYKLKIDSPAQLELAIIDARVARPSTSIDAERASMRGKSVRRLAHVLSGDLDTIVLKALAKDPRERYATVAAFADDLALFSSGRPVQARGPSLWYRTRKFVRRNRLAVSAASVGAIALVSLAAVSLWQAKIAREQAAAAAREAHRAEAVQNFLLDLFSANSDQQADPARARATTARELLDLGAARLQSALQDAPETRAEVMRTLADMYYELQLEEQSAAISTQRVALLKQLYGPDDKRVAEALIALATALHATSRRDEILPALLEAKRILDVSGDDSSRLRAELLTRLAQRYQNLSYEKMRDYADAAVAILRRYQVPNEDRMSTALHLAARARVQLGDYFGGESLYRDSLDELRKTTPLPQVALLQGAVSLAECLAGEQQFDAAVDTLRSASANARSTLGPDDPGALVADSHLAALLHATGHRDEADRMHAATLRRVLDLKGENDTLFTPLVRSDYGRSMFAEGQLQQAEDHLTRVVATNRRNYPNSAVLGQGLRTLATILTARGRYSEARQLFAEAWDNWQKGTGQALHPSRNNRFFLDEARLDLATHATAAATERLQRVVAPLDVDRLPMRAEEAERDILLACAYLQSGDFQRALTLARGAQSQIVTSSERADFPALEAEASVQLARALLANGDAAAARPHAERGLALRRDLDHSSSPRLAEAHLTLAAALSQVGETARANEQLLRAKAALAAQGEVGAQFRELLPSS